MTATSLRSSIILAGAVVSLACLLPAQDTLVVPVGLDTVEGNGANSFPWEQTAARSTAGIRVQFLYDSSHFTAAPASIAGPVTITRLRWRANGSNSLGWTGGTFSPVVIELSSAAVDWATPTNNFANNHGPDRTVVVNGPVTVNPQPMPAGIPGAWYVEVPLTTPFTYDPTSGNDLCVDIWLGPTAWSGGTTFTVDVQTSNPLASRVFQAANSYPATGSLGVNHGAVMELSYVSTQGLTAAFTATTPTRGASPLVVQFQDQSFSSAPGGVVAWAWDFDNDSVVDSTVQNPTHTYAGCGTWSVALTVIDGVNPPATRLKTGFVDTDEPTPDFRAILIGPDVMQFLDTTSPTATAWAWDLDGDSVTDSTMQNPVFQYSPAQACSEVNVSLTVSRLCRGPVTLSRAIAVSKAIDTGFDGFLASATTTGGTNFFDVNVTNPTGLVVCAMHVNSTAPASGIVTVNVYATAGTYVGKHSDASQWRLVATASAVSRGTAQRTLVSLPMPIYLAAGSHGLAVQHVGRSPGSGFSNIPANQTFTNQDLSLTMGIAQADPIFGSASAVQDPRLWNGALYYTTANVVTAAGYGFFGAGCAGSAGVPGNVGAALPRLGQTMTVDLTNMPGASVTAAFLLLGFSRTASPFGPLPLDVGIFGAPGCLARVSPDAAVLILGTAGSATFQMAIPVIPALLATQFFTQGLVLDAGWNALGGVTSDAAAGIIGN